MSFNAYCRECATHFADPFTKGQHVNIVHYGVPPPDPEISEDTFYAINSHVPQVRVKTCPVCLIHFSSLSACVFHVDTCHPSQQSCSLFRPTKEAVIYEWERLVEVIYPGTFALLRKNWRINRERCTNDDFSNTWSCTECEKKEKDKKKGDDDDDDSLENDKIFIDTDDESDEY
ncbi:hypothetical protein GCK72_021157 [Caenorhabditis remanei]|uniref:C2H2-type domain-containing protein n=1 Tax=Caenorhabditis remanei TaxID=31234 RepID=A0A6A5GIH5_CAERE|nr:hypothetical protein GCK72_021157 [Caenorhabditis remanei]KAF1754594.1 hypothetical protein GCK72_021157 [Caenorhabditis remanei]